MNALAGCAVCFGDDAKLARKGWQNTPRICSVVSESHFIVGIGRCGACGQRFVSVFCEKIDWSHGNDPQEWLLIPICEAEADALVAPGIDVETELSRLSSRRHLLSRWPSDAAEPEISYQTSSIYTPTHD